MFKEFERPNSDLRNLSETKERVDEKIELEKNPSGCWTCEVVTGIRKDQGIYKIRKVRRNT